MTSFVCSYEAQTHFDELLERVARGERIIITKHHIPMAVIQPVPPAPAISPEQTIAEIKALRRQYRLGGLEIRALKEEGWA